MCVRQSVALITLRCPIKMPQKNVLEGHGKKRKKKRMLTEDADSIVESDNDDVSIAGQDAPVDHVSRPFHVGPSVDVDHHRLGPGISDVCKSAIINIFTLSSIRCG